MDQTRWLSEREQRAWRAYLDANQLLWETLDRQLQRDSGMSHADYEILVRLSEAPERTLRMSELSSRTQYSPSRLSHAMSRLEGLGWVRRRTCPSDKRGTLASLTDDGFGVLERAAHGHVSAVREAMFDALEPQQVEQLERISTAMRKRMCAGSEAARRS